MAYDRVRNAKALAAPCGIVTHGAAWLSPSEDGGAAHGGARAGTCMWHNIRSPAPKRAAREQPDVGLNLITISVNPTSICTPLSNACTAMVQAHSGFDPLVTYNVRGMKSESRKKCRRSPSVRPSTGVCLVRTCTHTRVWHTR